MHIWGKFNFDFWAYKNFSNPKKAENTQKCENGWQISREVIKVCHFEIKIDTSIQCVLNLKLLVDSIFFMSFSSTALLGKPFINFDWNLLELSTHHFLNKLKQFDPALTDLSLVWSKSLFRRQTICFINDITYDENTVGFHYVMVYKPFLRLGVSEN